MKVALISFHNAYNYGACLQAYALQDVIVEMGVECEYIDYINQRRADGYNMASRVRQALKAHDIKSVAKNCVGAPFLWKRGKKFDVFYNRYLKRTDKVYHSCEEAEELNDKYDKFIVGSDQVWNGEHNGYDPAYFLGFVYDDSKKISYSSSFGLVDISDNKNEKYDCADMLKHISCLSTREQSGVDIIKKLTGRDAHLVLDPVLLLSAEKWKSFFSDHRKKERYTFYYINSKNIAIEDFGLITGIKDKKKHILSAAVTPKDFVKKDQKVTFAMSPSEFLEEIYYSELVVTTSFHCLAFAILFHKPFVAILSGDEGRDKRLINLLKITGLEKRILKRGMSPNDIKANINYAEVEKRLKKYRDYSEDFLKNAIFSGQSAVESLEEPVVETDDDRVAFTVCGNDKCTGCGACKEKCPKKAISMKGDEDGFLYPEIDESVCVKCGLCRKVCPALKNISEPQKQHYFAFRNTDKIRAISSSGGAFTAIADEMIKSGGVVVAAEMSKDWKLRHTIAATYEDVRKQAHTYYVQSEAFPQFSEIERMLNEGRRVLFVGTPCQVAGLKGYLRHDYEGLLLCDIICHGVPSADMFKIYIDYLKSRGMLTELLFRDKRVGWKGYNVSAVIGGKHYKNIGWLKAYLVMFSHGYINRFSCYSCPYTNYARQGDVTIGDFWGMPEKYRRSGDVLGVSLVITNSEKGEAFFKRAVVPSAIISVFKDETRQNSLDHPQKMPKGRLNCLMIMRKSYEKAAKKYGEWSIKGYMKETARALLKNRLQ